MDATTIAQIEKTIGYTFVNKDLLITAFTHSSFTNEFGEENNEKLEFLGDSLLNFIVSEYLYEYMQNEGALTTARSKIVSAAPLAHTIERLGLIDFMRLGAGASKESRSQKFVSDLFEAILGAIYLDGGITPCKRFVASRLDMSDYKKFTDYKTLLQELIQRKSDSSQIVYKTQLCTNERVFLSTVFVFSKPHGQGRGKRKKDAEQNAAKAALSVLQNCDEFRI